MHAVFKELPITDIQPGGWLRRYLEIQRHGLTGHLEAAQHPFNKECWTDLEEKPGWERYEQTGYWIDGMIRCGLLLGDTYLIEKAKKQLDFVLNHPDSEGYLGPRLLKTGERSNRWVHAVFFRALAAYYSETGDSRITDALTKHYLSEAAPQIRYRDVCNVEIMLWLYERTGDRRILEHAVLTYDEYNRLYGERDTSVDGMLSERRSAEHGVSYNEICKLGAIMYMHTGNEKYLKATLNAYDKLDRDQMLIDGVHSSSEELRGKDPLDSHETCDIADYTWSLGYLLFATGHAGYADKIERACFNAAPGAVRSDFKGLQYFSCPNQVIAHRTSNHNLYVRAHAWMSYRPNPGTECCPGDVNRIMPNYAARMWLQNNPGDITAALYGPGSVSFKAGSERQAVTIHEETDYPFSERIDFQIRTEAPVNFALNLRIPSWCARASILVNGAALDCECKPGTFVKLDRVFAHNDRVTLLLPMDIKLSQWPGGGMGIERGPLVYALRIEEKWEIDPEDKRCTPDFPAWNLYPASPWNYALCIDESNLAENIEIVHKPFTPEPWSIHSAPVELRVPARRVRGWDIERDKASEALIDTREGQKLIPVRGDFTPQLPDPDTLESCLSEEIETVTLVPYGCTKLRITVFPHCKMPG